jgi:hypothetical protein
MNEQDGFGSFWFWLNVVANYAQIESYEMNQKQLSNQDLMQHLQEQDRVLENQNKVLDEQTNIYLKKIVEQNEEIIRLLKGGK